MRRSSKALFSLALAACNDPPGLADPTASIVMERGSCPPPAADILIVIDDSPSMRNHQAQLAAGLRALGEYAGEFGDIRVAIVSTSGHAGELLTESCRSRLDTFVGPGEFESDVVDLRELCVGHCPHEALVREPSPIDEHLPALALRPWFESSHDIWGGNLATGVELADALACVGLRGFTGAEFESPIAAASAALNRMQTPGDPAFGFLREDVVLQVVFVGDEDDCSHPLDSPIFDPAGDRRFWTNPKADAPTSGVCVRAGTHCDAKGCRAVDRRADGELVGPGDRPVLAPVSEVRAQLEAIAEQRFVEVVIFGGVGFDGTLHAWPPGEPSDDRDKAWIEEFGAGWGMLGPDGSRAMAPWRLATIGDFGGIESLHSTTLALYDRLDHLAQMWPWEAEYTLGGWCLRLGVERDEQGQPECTMTLVSERADDLDVPLCEHDERGWRIDLDTGDYQVPAGADACWVWLDGPASECLDLINWSGASSTQIRTVIDPNSEVARDSVFTLTCEPEAAPDDQATTSAA